MVTLLAGAVAPAFVAASSALVGGCDTGTCSSGVRMFEVYAPGVDAAAVPLCTSGSSPGPSVSAEAGAGAGFPGSSALSPAAVAVCASLCTGAQSVAPCCVSVWEPNTVLCAPSCTP